MNVARYPLSFASFRKIRTDESLQNQTDVVINQYLFFRFSEDRDLLLYLTLQYIYDRITGEPLYIKHIQQQGI